MSFGLEHLMNPLVGGDFLASILGLIGQVRDQRDLRSDPNILGYINNRIGDYNAFNAYQPSTGQFNAGSPFGDAASGNGGAYGQDRRGNPLSPFQGNNRYNLSQLQGSQGALDTGLSNLTRAAEVAGVSGPSGFNLGVNRLGLDPGGVQGVDQSTRRAPQPMQDVRAPDDWLSNLIGSFAQGTTSIPQTGLALVHQGEAIVPREQNPLAQAPGVPGAPLAGGGALSPGQLPGSIQNRLGGGGAAPGSLPGGGVPMGAPAPPQLGGAPMGAPAAPMGAPAAPPMTPASPNYFNLSPGLSPQVQQQLVNQGADGLNRSYAMLERDLRNQGPAGNGGVVDRRLFDARLAQSGQQADLRRDVGLAAADRQFNDSLAANEHFLNRYLGEGQLGLGREQLGLERELGLGRLGLDTELGRGQLGLERELGLGRLGLDTELGRGQLGLGQQGLDLERELGLGQLGLGQGRLDLDTLLGQGGLANERRGLDIQEMLGQGGLANESRSLDIQQLLGQQGIDLERLLGLRGLEVQNSLGQGGLANERRGQDIQQLLGQRGLDLEQLLGIGNLRNDRYGLQTNRQLGQGQLDFTNRSFDADFSRGLANDAFNQYTWGASRNDALSQQDFQNQLQQYVMGQQQNQFGDLIGLLGQFSGQSEPEGPNWLELLLGGG